MGALDRARLGGGTGLAVAAALLARDLDLATLVSYWGDRTPLAVLGAALLVALWLTRLRPLVAGITMLLAATWAAAAFTPLTAWLARDLARRDPAGAADAVYVLASRIQDDGDLTSEAMSRLLHGLELLGEGRAERLILPELPSAFARYAPTARTLMLHLGLQRELLTVGPVRSTHEEAVAVAALCRARGWRRLLLVTSPTHSRRAAASFEHEGLVVLSSPSMETLFDFEDLHRPDDRLFAFGALVHERLGWLVYSWRGWVS